MWKNAAKFRFFTWSIIGVTVGKFAWSKLANGSGEQKLELDNVRDDQSAKLMSIFRYWTFTFNYEVPVIWDCVNEFIEIDLRDVRLSAEIDGIWRAKEEDWTWGLNEQALPPYPSHLKPTINHSLLHNSPSRNVASLIIIICELNWINPHLRLFLIVFPSAAFAFLWLH
jgi:hypothetical protein